jgi:hypothetical protein
VLVLVWVLVGGIASESGVAAAAPSQGDIDVTTLAGAGTASDPYHITNASELQAMAADLDAHYVLVADIDASETAGWNSGRGFSPIGSSTVDDFSGSFDGNGYTITGLTIDRPGTEYVGLFGYVEFGTITDAHLEEVDVTGGRFVGGLVGTSEQSAVTDSSVTGTVSGDTRVGGLVGLNTASSAVIDSAASATVTGTDDYLGGLVGRNSGRGAVIDSAATGDVFGSDTSSRVGGLVGENIGDGEFRSMENSVVVRSSATGDVSGGSLLGGLVGGNHDSAVIDSSATGDVTGTESVSGTQWAGGLIGLSDEGLVTGSSATGAVSGQTSGAGGLVGNLRSGTVSRSFATGSVTARAGDPDAPRHAGGLVGIAEGGTQIHHSYASGNVSGKQAGGLVGFLWLSHVSQTYAVGNVTASGGAGGLVGINLGGSLVGSYWDVETTGQATGVGADQGGGNANATGLRTAQMTGGDAPGEMPALDFPDEWRTTRNYPVLAWHDARTTGTTERSAAMGTAPAVAELHPSLTVEETAPGTGDVGTSGVTATTVSNSSTVSMVGSGTAEDPYRITNATELQAIADDLEAHYVLATDIDASETAAWRSGRGFEPIGNSTDRFRGSFDGDGHTISNLRIGGGDSWTGLFESVGLWGHVRDVHLENVNVTGSDGVGSVVGTNNHGTVTDVSATGSVTGRQFVGGLVGSNVNGGTVTGSTAEVTVSGTDEVGGLIGRNAGRSAVIDSSAVGNVTGSDDVGGLLGANRQSIVIDSAASGHVTGTEPISGEQWVGGLVGVTAGAVVIDSTATGTVTTATDAGGLIGWSEETVVVNTAATGNVGGTETVGGLVGSHAFGPIASSYATGGPLVGQNLGVVLHSYWDVETSGRTSSDGGIGLRTAQMTGAAARDNMRGIDVPADWYLTESYPVLAWQDAGAFLAVAVTGTTSPVEAGERLLVEVNVTNYGGSQGTQTVTLTDTGFTGSRQSESAVTLAAGASESVTLSWTPRRADAGVTGALTVASANDTDAVTVTVNDTALAITKLTVPSSAEEDTAVTVSGTFSGPRAVANHTAELDWGDGTIEQVAVSESGDNGTFGGEHTYADAGTYTLNATVADDTGANDTATEAVTVLAASGGGDGRSGSSGGGGGGGQSGAGPAGEVEITDRGLLNETVATDEVVVAQVDLANFDPVRGRTTLVLETDGSPRTEQTFAVGASTRRTVYLRTRFGSPGTYTLSVNGESVGEVTVEAAAPPAQTPTATVVPGTPTPVPTELPPPTSSPTSTPGSTGGPIDSPAPQTTSGDGSGFGLLLALLAIGSALLGAHRRT